MTQSRNLQLYQNNFTNKFVESAELQKPSRDVAKAIESITKSNINRIVLGKTETSHNRMTDVTGKSAAQFVKYTPTIGVGVDPNGSSQRIIKMHEVQKDPLQPAQFKHKRIPAAPRSPPPPIMHSPNRKVTAKDQLDWKVPPCISNWKNAKGYTIPLEMRISADGRTLQNHTVNEKFAQIADVYYLTERQARKEIEERNRLQKTLAYKEYLQKEEQMRDLAAKAREEKNRILTQANEENEEKEELSPTALQEKKERDEIRYIRKREQEREKRIENLGAKKAKTIRDQERDITEKIALGQAQPTQNELMFDQRLFNQTAGLDTGFGSDEDYNVYDKPLFNDKTAAKIYDDKEAVPSDEEKDQKLVRDTLKKPARGFEGAEKAGKRNKPVEFERHTDELFGMDDLITKKVKK